MSGVPHYKIVIVGDSGVGKTSLVNHITGSLFSDSHVPTVGSQFLTLPVRLEGQQVILELWDTAGQEIYRSFVGFYAREAKGAFVVCDVTRAPTIESLDKWIQFIGAQAPGVKVLVFANKCDLEDGRTIARERLIELCASKHADVIEGSARSGKRTGEAFQKMGEMMLAVEPNEAAALPLVNQTVGEKRKKKKDSDCC
jgi:small GTP-binding protein